MHIEVTVSPNESRVTVFEGYGSFTVSVGCAGVLVEREEREKVDHATPGRRGQMDGRGRKQGKHGMENGMQINMFLFP